MGQCKAIHPYYRVNCGMENGHTGAHSYSDDDHGISWGGGGAVGPGGAGGNDPAQFDFPSVIEYNKLKARERRERIATAVLAGFCSCPQCHIEEREHYTHDLSALRFAKSAVIFADALIRELDQ